MTVERLRCQIIVHVAAFDFKLTQESGVGERVERIVDRRARQSGVVGREIRIDFVGCGVSSRIGDVGEYRHSLN